MALSAYIPRSSFIHSLDPRSKIVLCIGLIIPSILIVDILMGFLLFLGVVILSALAKVMRIFLAGLIKTTTVIITLMLIGYGLFIGNTPLIILYDPILIIKLEGTRQALLIISRFLSVFGAAYFLTLTTHPGDLMISLYKIGLPYKAVYSILSTFQVVPTIEDRAKVILDAQKSRGLNIEAGVVTKIKGLVPLIVPLLMGTIIEAQERTIAIESRGFSSPIKKTFLRDVQVKRHDTMIMILSLGFALTLIALWIINPDLLYMIYSLDSLKWLDIRSIGII